ncbi:unnamed protein product, partial [marine sediment metagenome]
TISYTEQSKPRGLADAFLVGEDFIGGEPVFLILGDNILFGHGLPDQLREAVKLRKGAQIFAYQVKDPERYGVVELDNKSKVISIEEKPERPRSNWAIPGLYLFDERVVEFARELRPSPSRGELEIVDLIRMYLELGELRVERFGRGIAWLDAGTPESLLEAAQFVATIQKRQGMMISCPEEIALRMGYITVEELRLQVEGMGDNSYKDNLVRLLDEEMVE